MSLIGIIIWLVVFLILVVVVKMVIAELGWSPNAFKIAMLILSLIFILVLLHELGMVGGGGPILRIGV